MLRNHHPKALELRPEEHGLVIRQAVSLPSVVLSWDDLTSLRHKFEANLHALLTGEALPELGWAGDAGVGAVAGAVSGDELMIEHSNIVTAIERMHFYLQYVHCLRLRTTNRFPPLSANITE